MPTVGSLFSGAGLLDLGLHLAGFQHAWCCESDPWRRDLLRARFPGVPVHDDVRTLRGGDMPRLTDEQFAWACGMYDAERSLADIAAELPITRQALWQRMKGAGIDMRPQQRYGEDNHFHRGGVVGEDWAHNKVPRVGGDANGSPVAEPVDLIAGGFPLDPARAHQAPGSATGSSTPRPLCGSRCGASFANFDPEQCSSKTWGTSAGWLLPQASLLDPCGERFSGTWPHSGCVTSDGTAYPLAPSAPRTSVTGSSALLPTPTSQDGSNIAGPSQEQHNSPPLDALVRMLPTPVAGDGREKGGGGRWSPTSAPLEQTIKDDLLASTGASTPPPSTDGKPSTGLRLNPSFVEWMMGTPVCGECGLGWTDPDCQHSVTAYTSTAPGLSDGT